MVVDNSIAWKRRFFSGTKPCRNRCIYCFAKFRNKSYLQAYDSMQVEDGSTILYPICDSEVKDQGADYIDKVIEYCLKQKGDIIVSLSTKNNWEDSVLMKIAEFNLVNRPHKFIKLSVSFSCKARLEQIEKGTATLTERLLLLNKIKEYGIPTCVIIKPILPFVSLDDYKRLIDECKPYCRDFVLGGLYVDIESPFYANYIKGKYPVEKKYCDWLGIECFYVQNQVYSDLKDYINGNGCAAYDSDKEFLMKTLKGV